MPLPLPSSLIDAVTAVVVPESTDCALAGAVIFTAVGCTAMFADADCVLSVAEAVVTVAVHAAVIGVPAVYVTVIPELAESDPQPVTGLSDQLAPPLLRSFVIFAVSA
jgi:hypothetical protein